MIVSGPHVTGLSGGGSPPSPPPPSSAIVCTDCGNCSFSAQSYMQVTKFIPSCAPSLVLTEQQANWPWFSASAAKTRWQFDAANWIEYDCFNNKWSFAATGIDFSLLVCVQNTNPGFFFYFASICQGFEWRKETSSGVYTTFLRAVLKNNVCIPSVAVP